MPLTPFTIGWGDGIKNRFFFESGGKYDVEIDLFMVFFYPYLGRLGVQNMGQTQNGVTE